MIRHTFFVRDQMADLACMNRHIENFPAVLPRDGTTVEFQSLIFILNTDTITDF